MKCFLPIVYLIVCSQFLRQERWIIRMKVPKGLSETHCAGGLLCDFRYVALSAFRVRRALTKMRADVCPSVAAGCGQHAPLGAGQARAAFLLTPSLVRMTVHSCGCERQSEQGHGPQNLGAHAILSVDSEPGTWTLPGCLWTRQVAANSLLSGSGLLWPCRARVKGIYSHDVSPFWGSQGRHVTLRGN